MLCALLTALTASIRQRNTALKNLMISQLEECQSPYLGDKVSIVN